MEKPYRGLYGILLTTYTDQIPPNMKISSHKPILWRPPPKGLSGLY